MYLEGIQLSGWGPSINPKPIVKKKSRILTNRKLKVYPKFMQRSYHNNVVFPEIRLAGKWLADVGFECGKTVQVEVSESKLVITIV